MKPVHSEALDLWFDETTRIYHVTYKGKLVPDSSVKAYSRFGNLVAERGLDAIWGAIFDFRPVTEFHNTNLTTTQNQSRQANRQYDLSRLPVALVVDDFYKEQMVRVSARVNKVEKRTRIVYSTEEALKFFEVFHESLPPKDSEVET